VPLPGLTSDELAFFEDGVARFQTVEAVSGAAVAQGNGLSPRFNSDQCSSCHSQPYVGGSSPARNPLISVASADGARNAVPWFITSNGPVREARFVASTPLLGDGLIEAIPNSEILANMSGNRATKQRFGVLGHPNAVLGGTVNRSTNDGTITRFGWKAQNKSL
jgi:CxxC motif-containing protein (DUF1111 family)